MEAQELLPIIAAVFALLVVFSLFFLARPKKSAWKAKALSNLAELENRLASGDSLHLKSALVDADKLLDFAMKSRGLRGETMGERLKNAVKYFDKNQYNRIWDAHKLRNRLVHEIDFTAKENHIKEAYSTLKSAIHRLSS